MLSLYRNEKIMCENCGTQTTKFNLAHRKNNCSAVTLYCTQCPIFSTKSKTLNYQFAKKHRALKYDVTFKKEICSEEF